MEPGSECSRLNAGCLSSKSQEYVPSGIPSLDSILNSGYPLGALILIEEDELRVYSDTFIKYFLAEGIANQDYVFLASRDNDPLTIIRDLPQAVKIKDDDAQETPADELKIAWRYQSNNVIQSSPSARKGSYSHDFDFTSKLSNSILSSADYTIWPKDASSDKCESLFNAVCATITSRGLWFGHEAKNPEKKILRVCINGMGSPFWPNDASVSETLFKLRTMIHNSSSVAMVSLPVQVLDLKTVLRCEQISDIVISLKSLANSTNKQYSDYSGLMKFLKISPINLLAIHVPDDRDWAFKLKKKKLIIEKLHLPPETSVTEQREQDDFRTTSKPACQLQF